MSCADALYFDATEKPQDYASSSNEAAAVDRLIDVEQLTYTHFAIVGGGPVGMRMAEELLKRIPNASVTVYGNEPYAPYDRIKLSALLAGQVSREDIFIAEPQPSPLQKFSYKVAAIHHIDKEYKLLRDISGENYRYDTCVLAVGAKAFIPDILGRDLQGVYTFRNLDDTEALYTRVFSSKHVVVIGGGLLGLEAAKGLMRFNTKVTVIQQGEFLMNRQLDKTSADILQKKIQDYGVEVIINEGVRQILGDQRVDAVRTRSGRLIECDTVLFCAGISPNIELAANSDLRVGRGIVVNDSLQTSDPDIYAVGECIEHRGKTYGLVAPGFEQATVLAKQLAKEPSKYIGSALASQLKVVGESVSSVGEVSDLVNRPKQMELVWHNKVENLYRKLVIHKGRIIGAVSIGEWSDYPRVQQLFKDQAKIQLWQIWRFKLTGNLWSASASAINAWPDATIVCQCQQVSKGTIKTALLNGSNNLEALSCETGAGSACGSCKPLLSELMGQKIEKEKAWLPHLMMSSLAFMIVLAISYMPQAEVSTSVLTQGWFEKIWNDKFYKQVTGFSLLGLTLIGMLMSLRKRFNWQWLGKFNDLRVFHIVLGVSCLAGLILHTGFHLGENLNRLLMLNFLGVTVLGAVAGMLVGSAHWLPAEKSQMLRKRMSLVHILIAWPLPVLLIFHVLSVYYF